ncbi:rRNA maturation RNase YbeY [Shimia sagamensis]|uniref:Endoribonuclease YbeY n=1 Tax=Shimia sagamensis TaxID=1566352 RepID=A0ABY1PH74_9RHOB|nr:rRNA maturation RNase YbeY [Shimia sagamensis]SMP33291.1 probable rRNA maturation factor [Shimia sagamensis]
MLTDTIFEDDRWNSVAFESLAETAAQAVLGHLCLETAAFEIAVLACDDARIAELNADFRDKDKATNVLSWPSEERGVDMDGDTPDLPEQSFPSMPEELGDIAISYDTCAREAVEAGKSMADHVMHLMVHGTLHLLGYDHVRDKDATLMEGLEATILGKLGLSDPYDVS